MLSSPGVEQNDNIFQSYPKGKHHHEGTTIIFIKKMQCQSLKDETSYPGKLIQLREDSTHWSNYMCITFESHKIFRSIIRCIFQFAAFLKYHEDTAQLHKIRHQRLPGQK